MKYIKNLIRAVKTIYSIAPWHTVLIFVLGEVVAFLPLLGAIVARKLFNMVGSPDQIQSTAFVFYFFMYFVYLLSFKFYSVYFQRVFIQFHTMPLVEKRIKENLFRVVQDIPMDNNETPDFPRRIWAAKVASINIFRLVESGFLVISIITSLLLLSRFVISINLSFFIVLLFTAVSSFMKAYFEGSEKSKAQKQRTKLEHMEKESRAVLETVGNYKEIKLFHSFDFFYENWQRVVNTLTDYNYKTDLRILKKKAVFIFIESISYALLFWIAIRGLSDRTLDFGSFMATIQVSQNLQLQLQRLLGTIGNIGKFSQWTEPYYDFLDLREDEIKAAIEYPLEFKEINYSYPTRSEPAIENVSIRLNKGDKVAFVGLNGAGKSTLVKLLLLHLRPSTGTIFSGGRQLSEQEVFTPDSYTAVFQEPCHYEINLLENIRFGNSEKDDELLRWLEYFALDKINREVSLGLELGSTNLSGGEWQVIGLSRGF